MSLYFLDTKSGVYRMDATVSVTKKLTGKASDNIIESGETTSDNYVNLPDRFSLSGVISDITSSAGSTRSSEDYIRGLTKVKEEGEVFTFFFGFSVKAAQQCVIETIEFTQDSTNGYSDGSNSFKVKLGLKRLRFSEEILITQERNPKFSDAFQKKQEGAGSATEAPKEIRGAARIAQGLVKIETGWGD